MLTQESDVITIFCLRVVWFLGEANNVSCNMLVNSHTMVNEVHKVIPFYVTFLYRKPTCNKFYIKCIYVTKYFLDNFSWCWHYETWTAETCTDENRNSVSYVSGNSYAPSFLMFDINI